MEHSKRVAGALRFLCFLVLLVLAMWGLVSSAGTGYARPVSIVTDPQIPISCFTIYDSITNADPVRAGMLEQTNNPTECEWSPTPPPMADTEQRHTKVYNYYFPFGSFSTQCVTVTLTANGCPGNLFSVAYGYGGYRGDIGAAVQGTGSYSFLVFRGTTFSIVVHEVAPNSGCPAYTLTVSSNIGCSSITTQTPTPMSTPTSTPSIGRPCGYTLPTATTTCQAPSTYNYNFSWYVESDCGPAQGTAILRFEVAPDDNGPWTLYDAQTRSVSFPGGPGYGGFSGSMIEEDIPEAYTHYRIVTYGPTDNAYFNATTNANAICRTGGTITPPVVTGTPQATSSATSTAVPTSTGTPVQATNTVITTATAQPPTSTSVTLVSPTTTATREPCTITFSDVPDTNSFYHNIRCLACRGIISGYADGTFRPGNEVTRGQLAKIVSNAAGFAGEPRAQIFEDVAPDSTFYQWVDRLTVRGYMSGYNCGGPGEPCVNNRPYFRPFANATRAQTSKIVSNAARYTEPPTGQSFEDVPPTDLFYEWIQRLASRGKMGGYPCGGPGEPCGAGNKPYFRPNNDVTRGQSAKIVANTFYTGCVTP